jgi:hypothetical protein
MKKLFGVLGLMAVAAAALAFNGGVSGYIPDNADEDEFAVLADSKSVDVVFDWPDGAAYWVTVYGRSHNELGKFNLLEGDTINLTGGGLFYLEIISKDDTAGDWSASWEDTD